MTASSPVTPNTPGTPFKWALLASLLVAGALGNYFKYPLFFEIDFLFGSIFSFLIFQFYGRAYGIGAALLVSGVTYFIWGHPYAVVIMTVELAFVAFMTGRYKISLVFADAMYWVLLGMPMVYLFYHGVMGVPDGFVTITMTKQAVNGITNVLLARLIFMLIGFRTGRMTITLREILHTCMVLCVALPMLILIIIDSRSDFDKGIARSQVELKNAALKINNTIQLWLENRADGLASIANVAALGDASKTQAALDLVRDADSQLLRVGFLSPAFITKHYSPLVNAQGQSNIGIDFSDRAFVPQLRGQPKPMLSEIMAPRLGSSTPIVAYLNPVMRDNQVMGYISGVLSLDQLSGFIAREANASSMRFTLVDRGAKVIFSNRDDQKSFAPFAAGDGSFNKIDETTSQWIPKIRANAPFYERFRNSYYVNDSAISRFSDWRLVLEQPVGPMQKALSATYTQRLILLLILLLLGTLLAELVSRQVLKTFEVLREVTGDLPARLASSKTIEWPESRMSETRSLIANFQSMAVSLQAEFASTHAANALLESRVALRTNELTESEARLVFAQSVANIGSWAVDFSTLHSNWSAQTYAILELEAGVAKPSQKSFLALVHPDDSKRVGTALAALFENKAENAIELRIVTRSGVTKNLEVRWLTVFDGEEKPVRVVGTCQDITGRVRGAEEQRALAERLALAVRAGTIGIWDYNIVNNTVMWDDAMYALYGLSPGYFGGAYEAWRAGVHPDDQARCEEETRLAHSGEKEYDTEFRVCCPNGEIRTLRALAIVQRDGTGKALRMVGTNWDITAQKQIEAALKNSLDEKDALLKEVHHRVKNNLQVVTSLLRLEARRSTAAEAINVLKAMQGRIQAMAQLHESLYRSGTFASIDLGVYLGQIASQTFRAHVLDGPPVQLKLNMGTVLVGMDQAIGCGLLVNELVTNCLKHAFADTRSGEVLVELQPANPATVQTDALWRLRVSDTGTGLPADFESRRTHSLGMQLVDDLSHQVGGTLAIQSPAGAGAEFSIVLKALAPAALVMPK